MLKYHFSRIPKSGNFSNGVIAIECFLSSPSSPSRNSIYLPEQFTSKGDWIGEETETVVWLDSGIYMYINRDSGVPMDYMYTSQENVFNMDRVRAVYNLKKQHPKALDTKIWTF